MRKQSIYDKLKTKSEEKKYVKELVAAFKESDNKHDFLKEHPSLFATAGVLNLSYFLPNGTIFQNFATFLMEPLTTYTSSYTFIVPYKITFKISNLSPIGCNPMMFIRDNVTTGLSNATPYPDPALGNKFIFGGGSNAQAITQTTTGVIVDSSFGASTTNGALITIQEQINNAIQINVYNGITYNSQSYTSIVGVFTTPTRNIGLYADLPLITPTSLTCAYAIAPTVSW